MWTEENSGILLVEMSTGAATAGNSYQKIKNRTTIWGAPDSPVAKTSRSNTGGVGSIPGWGVKTPYATWPKQKQKPPKRTTETML